MTYKDMKCSARETARRQDVVIRLNLLYDRRSGCEDRDKIRRLDKEINQIRADESRWLKQAAYFLY